MDCFVVVGILSCYRGTMAFEWRDTEKKKKRKKIQREALKAHSLPPSFPLAGIHPLRGDGGE